MKGDLKTTVWYSLTKTQHTWTGVHWKLRKKRSRVRESPNRKKPSRDRVWFCFAIFLFSSTLVWRNTSQKALKTLHLHFWRNHIFSFWGQAATSNRLSSSASFISSPLHDRKYFQWAKKKWLFFLMILSLSQILGCLLLMLWLIFVHHISTLSKNERQVYSPIIFSVKSFTTASQLQRVGLTGRKQIKSDAQRYSTSSLPVPCI